jgi:hypothetical protein
MRPIERPPVSSVREIRKHGLIGGLLIDLRGDPRGRKQIYQWEGAEIQQGVAAHVDFSACDPSQYLIEKVDVATALDVTK